LIRVLAGTPANAETVAGGASVIDDDALEIHDQRTCSMLTRLSAASGSARS
jgi:hypothetical protein